MSDLQAEIQIARQTIRSDSYSMSIGEIVNLYKSNEIVIRPEFQRLFRWNIYQRSRLIESILLGIPLPPIFVMQREDSVWEVIDGLQRLSTILQFMGELRDADHERLVPPDELVGTEYLPSLAGVTYDQEDSNASLDDAQRIALRRAKIDITILLPESDSKAKGELFDRLNAGGSLATAQEIRMAQFVMRDATFARWINELKGLESFTAVTPLSDRLIDQSYDTELVCRFMVLENASDDELAELDNIDEYLSSQSYRILADEKYERGAFGELFRRVFELLQASLGDNSFRRYDVNRGAFKGAFAVSAFEVVTCGLAQHIDAWEESAPRELEEKVASIWSQSEFTGRSGSGKSSRDRIPHTVPWARQYFAR